MANAEVWLNNRLGQPSIIIIGSGSLGKLVIDMLIREKKYDINNIAILDDDISKQNTTILGIPVIGKVHEIPRNNKYIDTHFIIAIANNTIRKKIAIENKHLNYISIISEEAIISPFSEIGQGVIILPGAVVDPDATLENHVIVNKLVSVAHDVILKEYSQVSPGVKIGGNVKIGKGAFLGLGAIILPELEIANDIIIGAGAVVTKSILQEKSTYVGNPAKCIKVNE